MNNELKEFIEAIISCIDTTNESTEGKADTSGWYNQLIGVQIALHTQGIKIEYDINPYYYADKKQSTYTVKIALD